MKILVQWLTNCKSYRHLHDGVSAFIQSTLKIILLVEGWLNVLYAVSLLCPMGVNIAI